MQPGGRLTGRIHPGNRRCPGLGFDPQPAHRVMDGRRDLHRLLRDVDIRQPEELLVHRRQLFLDFFCAEVANIQVRAAVFRAASRLDFLVDGPRHHIARGELLLLGVDLEHEALAVAVRQVTTLAPDGLGDQDAPDSRRPDHAGGMELDHLRVEDLGPGVEAHGDAVAGALPGIRRDFVETAPAAGRNDDGLGSEGDEGAVDPVVAEGADDPVAVLEQLGQRYLHVHLDAELDEVVLETADHFQAGAITDVAKPAVRMGAKGPLQHAAVGGPVEDRAVGLQLVDAIRRLAGMKLRHPPVVDHLTAPHRVLEMNLPVVLRVEVAQGRGNAALGHDRVRFAQERLAHHVDSGARGRRLDRGAHAGARLPARPW